MNDQERLKRCNELIVKVFHQNKDGEELLKLLFERYAFNATIFYVGMEDWNPAFIAGQLEILRDFKRIIDSALKLAQNQQNQGINV